MVGRISNRVVEKVGALGVKAYTLRKRIKLRGILRAKGSTLNENEVSAHQLRFLREQGAIGPDADRQVLVSIAAPAKPLRQWPKGCCGR